MTKSNNFYLLLLVMLLTPLVEVVAQTSTQAEPPQPAMERRVGVQTSKRVTLTLREAMLMALENNREIEVERLNVQMSEFDLRAAKGVYDPTLSAGFFYDRSATPVASLLAGGEGGK